MAVRPVQHVNGVPGDAHACFEGCVGSMRTWNVRLFHPHQLLPVHWRCIPSISSVHPAMYTSNAHLPCASTWHHSAVLRHQGEEENGSAGFHLAMQQHETWFEDTKLVLISNTTWVGENVPCLTYGMRGMIALSVEVCHLFSWRTYCGFWHCGVYTKQGIYM
jgi:hypothetical protein